MTLVDRLIALTRRLLRSLPPPIADGARSLRRHALNMRSSRRVFEEIFRGNEWGASESVSGPGSTLAATNSIRTALPALLSDLGVSSVLDLPCGDAHWISECLPEHIRYTGGDIVEEIVQRNRRIRSKLGEFIVCDLVRDQLPRADLILVRDCFIHLPFRRIHESVRNIKRSGAKYLLTTSFSNVYENIDIEIGGFRKIDLTKPPFSFPRPLLEIPDDDQAGASAKRLMLWEVARL